MVSHLYARNGNLTSWSGGDQMFQGTVARYRSRDIQAGVGERARADARIILQGVKTEVFRQRTKESNYVVWQKQLNQGSRTETLTLPSFTGTIHTPFRAPGGISVQIPAGEFRSQIATLSQQPGMGYLNELAARSDVNWQPVKLAHDKWDFKQEGLTPAGAALIGFAVAMATGGAGPIVQFQIVLEPGFSRIDASAPNGRPHADCRCAARAPGFFGLGCRR